MRLKTNTNLFIPLSYLYYLWLLLSSFTFVPIMVNAEFYSSVDSLRKLGSMEATLLKSFRYYLKEQQQDIDIVRGFIKNIKFHHELASKDINDYIGNPINAFTLIKRMVNDWTNLNEFLKFNEIKNDMKQSLTQFQEDDIQPPDENELQGAIRGLARLQDIYRIKTDEMANGYKHGNPLSWRACLEIGTTLFDDENYQLSKDWFEISLKKLEDNQKESSAIKTTFKAHIKEYLAWVYHITGELEKALNNLNDILETEPENAAKFTEKLILNTEILEYDKGAATAEKKYTRNYERLCRGENLTKNLILTCKLDTEIHPFFILAPLQVEPIKSDPSITLYHNLLNEAQISKLLERTDKGMSRSKVVYVNSSSVSESRVSQQVWVRPKESNIANMMYNLLAVISGFDTTNTEQMQVANYGIGGLYEPHHDYLYLESKQDRFNGNRIATNMFYLSDVAEGGYTVFPYLDVYLKPVKGAMVMWYNLHKSLDADSRTLHAGCPVLRGSKRIANIWTHSGSQEFRRPCGLMSDSQI